MTAAIIALCAAQFTLVDVTADMSFVPPEHKDVPAQVLWMRQCVAKKEAGFL